MVATSTEFRYNVLGENFMVESVLNSVPMCIPYHGYQNVSTLFGHVFRTIQEGVVMYENYCIVRDLQHVTDYQVAKATGINRSTFSDWKSGRSVPKYEKIKKIAEYFGCSPEFLNGADVPMFPTEKQEGEMGKGAEKESVYLKEIDFLMSSLSENAKQRLLAYARGLYDARMDEAK